MRYNVDLHYDFKNYFKKYTLIPNLILKHKKYNFLKLSKYSNSYVFLTITPFNHLAWSNNKNKFYSTKQSLALNFKRNRFFPTIRTLAGESYIFLSLGMLSKFFLKNKSFLKSKSMYLLLMGFFRKILLFSSFRNLILIISKTPLFLKELLSIINNPVTKVYKHPFSDDTAEIDEKKLFNPFRFSLILFINNKSFAPFKVKKKGRLKRKISKKIVLLNKLTD